MRVSIWQGSSELSGKKKVKFSSINVNAELGLFFKQKTVGPTRKGAIVRAELCKGSEGAN